MTTILPEHQSESTGAPTPDAPRVSFNPRSITAQVQQVHLVTDAPDLPVPFSSVGRMFSPRNVEVLFVLGDDNQWRYQRATISGQVRVKSGKLGQVWHDWSPHWTERPRWVDPLIDHTRAHLPAFPPAAEVLR